MLSLHTTFKNFVFVPFSFLVFMSCSNHSKKDIEIIKMLNESIENSNRSIKAECIEVLTSLKAKLNEASTHERAKVWFPKAEKIQHLSKDVYDYIQNLKENINGTVLNHSELFDKLKNYENRILQVDQKIANQFQKSLKMFTESIDSSKSDQRKLFKKYFSDISDESKIAMLNKLQNNLRINEVKIITFCHEQCGVVAFGPCSPDLPIVVQNSTIVQPGEKIEITTGICSFYTTIKPEVFVYEKPVSVGPDGVAISRFKAESKPGKYHVPIKINYIDQNGIEQSIQKEIEYTVANIQKQ